MSERLREQLSLVLALLVVGSVYLWRLDAPLLWGDEADTAVFARNVLAFGVPVGYDGQNVVVHRDCVQVGQGLLSRLGPWPQYYLGAASMLLWGATTAGVRVLFAVAGLCALIPLRAVLAERARHPTLLAMVALLAPQTVLLQRQARYYPIVSLLFALILWAVASQRTAPRKRLAVLLLALALSFHAQPISGCVGATALLLFAALRERRLLLPYLGISAAAGLAWYAWYASLPPIGSPRPAALALLGERTLTWGALLLQGLVAWPRDLDRVGALPAVAWGLSLVWARWRAPGLLGRLLRDRLVLFVLLNLLVGVVACSAVLGTETRVGLAQLRYLPHLVLTLALPLGLLLERLLPARGAGPLALAAALTLNPATASSWLGGPAAAHLSWARPVYAELFDPPPEGMRDLLGELRIEAARADQPPLVAVHPHYLGEVVLFYLDKDIRLRPAVQPGSCCARAVEAIAGPEVVSWAQATPDWIVARASLRNLPARYRLREFPCGRPRADATRPELTRHAFYAPGGPALRFYAREP